MEQLLGPRLTEEEQRADGELVKISEKRTPLPAGSERGVDGWMVEVEMELLDRVDYYELSPSDTPKEAPYSEE